MASIRMPLWLRMVLVAGVFVLVTEAGLFAYRWYIHPTTLTVAVGSLDGEATKLMSALASRLTAANAPVRLKLVETTSALEAADMFSSNKTDLAVRRGRSRICCQPERDQDFAAVGPRASSNLNRRIMEPNCCSLAPPAFPRHWDRPVPSPRPVRRASRSADRHRQAGKR